MRPNAAASKCAYDTLHETVARSFVFACSLFGSCCLVHSYAVALKQSCTHTHTSVHPHTRTHTPAAITSVAQTKPARSITRCHCVCLCVGLGLGWMCHSPRRFERLRKDIEHVVSARAALRRPRQAHAQRAVGCRPATALVVCASVAKGPPALHLPQHQPAPSTTATATTKTSQVPTVCYSYSYSYSFSE